MNLGYKLKSLIQRTLAFTLVLTMLIPTPLIQAEASGVTGIVGGGGNGTAKGTDNYKAYNRAWSGYRFYLIDKNLSRVTPVYDYYFTTPSEVSSLQTSTRFDTASSPSESTWKHAHMNVLVDMLNANGCPTNIGDIVYPVFNNTGHGKEFRAWFLKNLPGSVGGGGGSNIGGINLATGTTNGGQNTNIQLLDKSGTGSTGSNIPYYDSYISNGSSIMSHHPSPAVRYAGNNGIVTALHVNEFINDTTACKSMINNYDDQIELQYNYAYNYFMTMSQGMPYKNDTFAKYYALGWVADTYNLGVYENYIICACLGIAKAPSLSSGTVQISDLPNSDILTQSIPLSAYESSEGCPALVLLSNPAFIDTSNTGYSDALLALASKDYYLIVEPITWLYVGTAPGQYPAKGGRTYGSFYNLANLWKGNDDGGFYKSHMGELLASCLILEEQFTTTANQTLQASYIGARPVSKSVNEMNSGVGTSMHLYSALHSSFTSTYDEPVGDVPAPAPDDSKQLSETDKTDETLHANIVKFYEGYDKGEIVEKHSFTRETTPKKIEIENEVSWKVKEWYTSPMFKPANGEGPNYSDYKGSMPVAHGDTGTGAVELTDDTTLYVLLVKDADRGEITPVGEGDWTLTQSRLTRYSSTTNTHGGEDVLSTVDITIRFPGLQTSHSVPYDCGSCHGGHGDSDGDGHSDDCGSCHGCTRTHHFDLDDDTVDVWLTSINKDASLISPLGSGDHPYGDKWNGSQEATRGTLGGTTDTASGYIYDFLIHRAKKDATMIYNGLVGPTGSTRGEVEGALTSIGFTSGITGASTRKNGLITPSLTLSFKEDTSKGDLETTSVCEKGDDSDAVDSTAQYSINGSVAINTYAGIKNLNTTAKSNTDEIMYIPTDGYDKVTGRMISGQKSFSFTPYIQMQYDGVTAAKNQKAYVVGQYKRTMYLNDYAEIAWKVQDEGNLHLTSNQWSTHAGAMELTNKLLGETMTNSVLPGGALHSLDTKGSEQEVMVSTFQTILINNGLTQANATAATSDELSESKALTYHDEYVQSVIDGFTTTPIEQYVDTSVDRANAFDGIEVYPGADIKSLKNGSPESSKDIKYYFKDDPSGTESNADDNDLDAEIDRETTKYYTFYSDVKGDIYMAEVNGNSTVSNKKILNKYQTADSISDKVARDINLRTHVVDNLIASIERNTGEDAAADWATDGHWYNEAFNGVTVIVQRTWLKVGLYDPSLRTAVLDPKLVPQQESKGKIFTDLFISQFRSSDTSEKYGEPNVIGTFKGQKIHTRDLEMLFVSNAFYIPDANVQDLS